MIKIVKEVDKIKKHPDIATDVESFQDPQEFSVHLPKVKKPAPRDSKSLCAPPSAAASDSKSDGTISSGVWDTWTIHDWLFPMQRTEAVLEYSNEIPERPIPNIIVGFRKMDTWHRASLRFSTNTDFVTAKNFHIGVDQWSDSTFFGGEFSWVAVPPNRTNIQAGKLDCHTCSVQRNIRFAKPFSTRPTVLAWISGLDLRIGAGKRVHVATTSINQDGFAINVAGPQKALAWSTISWIAVTKSSPYLTGKFDCTVNGQYKDGSCTFPKDKFAKPPQVLVAFSSFDINGCNANPRFGICTAAVTTDGFKWNVYSWEDSSIQTATVQWLAIPAK